MKKVLKSFWKALDTQNNSETVDLS